MITLAAYDITVSSWLIYAFSSMLADPFYALVISIATTMILFYVIGKSWGHAWNKKWDLSGNRALAVVLISLVGGVSLAAVNGLYGGKFFQMEVAEAMAAIQEAGAVRYDELKEPEMGYSAARGILDKVQKQAVETEEEKMDLEKGKPIFLMVDDKIVAPYFKALHMLWTVFGVVTGALFVCVPWFAFKDIKVKEKFNI